MSNSSTERQFCQTDVMRRLYQVIKKPCPFCCNPNAPENDTGGGCCFCDYEGVVSIGYGGNFSNIEQYNRLYYATSHKERIDELHGRNNAESSRDFL